MAAGERPTTPARALEEARLAIARAQAAALEQETDEALRWYTRAVALSGDRPEGLRARSDALRGAGIVRQARAEWAGAERDFRASREAASRIGDQGRIGRAENCLAAVAFERGDWQRAASLFEAVWRAAESHGDAELLAQVENNLGSLLSARGEHARAEALFRRALARFEDLEQSPCTTRVLNNLGLTLARQARHPQAMLAYDHALEQCKRQGDAALAAKILINQARLALARGDLIAAHATAGQAWAFARGLRDGPVAAGALCLLGEVAVALHDFVTAIYYLRRALKRTAGDKAPLIEAETWIQIGNLYEKKGELQRAIDTWQYARLCLRRLGARADADRIGERIDMVTGQRPAAG